MTTPRLYPPDWCTAEVMAYLLCMGETTFRMHVAAGLLPAGVEIGGKTLWERLAVNDALAKLRENGGNAAPDCDILKAARGQTEKASRVPA